jgi:hypothetical protein
VIGVESLMSEELRRALIELLAAGEVVLDLLGNEGIGGQDARDYEAARTRVLELAPELNLR